MIETVNTNEVTQELLDALEQERKAAFVIPAGEYEGVIVEYSQRDPQGDPTNMFYGRTLWSTNWKLFDVKGKDRQLNYINMCPTLVKTENGRVAMPCVLAGALVKATEKKNLTEAMDEAKVNRMKLTIVVSKDGTKNYVNRIVKA